MRMFAPGDREVGLGGARGTRKSDAREAGAFPPLPLTLLLLLRTETAETSVDVFAKGSDDGLASQLELLETKEVFHLSIEDADVQRVSGEYSPYYHGFALFNSSIYLAWGPLAPPDFHVNLSIVASEAPAV